MPSLSWMFEDKNKGIWKEGLKMVKVHREDIYGSVVNVKVKVVEKMRNHQSSRKKKVKGRRKKKNE